jgi:hypothetical protein
MTAAVSVELVVLALGHGGVLGWKSAMAPAAPGVDPDDVAWSLAQDAGGLLSHSTSWRWDGGRVILTYATVLGSAADGSFERLPEPAIVGSDDVTHPRPRVVHGHHIAAHAIQHLADLARRDPVVRRAALSPATAEVWAAIRTVAGSIPTDSHVRAHREAHAVFDAEPEIQSDEREDIA